MSPARCITSLLPRPPARQPWNILLNVLPRPLPYSLSSDNMALVYILIIRMLDHSAARRVLHLRRVELGPPPSRLVHNSRHRSIRPRKWSLGRGFGHIRCLLHDRDMSVRPYLCSLPPTSNVHAWSNSKIALAGKTPNPSQREDIPALRTPQMTTPTVLMTGPLGGFPHKIDPLGPAAPPTAKPPDPSAKSRPGRSRPRQNAARSAILRLIGGVGQNPAFCP